MKANNAVLLGFVSKACEQIETLVDNNQNISTELSTIDLADLKNKLSEKFDSYFDVPKNKVDEFIKAGRKLFNEYIDSKKETTLIDEFASIFEDEESNNDKVKKLLDSFKNEYNEVYSDQGNAFDENDPALNMIYANAILNLNPEQIVKEIYKKQEYKPSEDDAQIDSIFSEIINQETKVALNLQDDIKEIKENEEELFKDRINDIYVVDNEKKLKPINDKPITIVKTNDDVKEVKSDDDTLFQDRLNDIYLVNNKEKLQPIKEDKIVIINTDNDIRPIKTNEDNLFNERFEEFNEIDDDTEDSTPLPIYDEEVKIPDDSIVDEKNVSEIHDRYIKDLINQLEVTNSIEEEKRKELEIAAQKEKVILDNLKERYPYLNIAEIKAIYDLKDELNNDYPDNKDLILLHRCKFTDLDELQQFVEIMVDHNYHINCDETKMIVDVFKAHHNTKGKIISLIFEIANQAKLLNAAYEGYRVIDNLQNWR